MTLENEVRKLARLVQELAEINAIQELRIIALELSRDTGQKHVPCPECKTAVRATPSGAYYANHSYPESAGKLAGERCVNATERIKL